MWNILNKEALFILEKTGVFLKGHFILTSGLHSGEYVDKVKLLNCPLLTVDLANLMARYIVFFKNIKDFNVVVSPAIGGAFLGFEVALICTSDAYLGRTIKFAFTEKKEGKMVLGRDQEEVLKDQTAIIVEDIFTTGGSARGTLEIVKGLAKEVSLVIGVLNRGGITSKEMLGYPLMALVNRKIESWREEECPLCKKGIQITRYPGHGWEYLQKEQSASAAVA